MRARNHPSRHTDTQAGEFIPRHRLKQLIPKTHTHTDAHALTPPSRSHTLTAMVVAATHTNTRANPHTQACFHTTWGRPLVLAWGRAAQPCMNYAHTFPILMMHTFPILMHTPSPSS